jgi:hypothetical protein
LRIKSLRGPYTLSVESWPPTMRRMGEEEQRELQCDRSRDCPGNQYCIEVGASSAQEASATSAIVRVPRAPQAVQRGASHALTRSRGAISGRGP